MNFGLIALIGTAVLAAALVLRDPAVRSLRARVTIVAVLTAAMTAVGVFDDSNGDRLGLAAMIGLVCIVTLGRPALLVDDVLTDQAKSDSRLDGRKAAGTGALLVSLFAFPLIKALIA